MRVFGDIAGKVISAIWDYELQSHSVTIIFDDDTRCTLGYSRDFCESPHVDDVSGKPDSMIDQVVVSAEEYSFDSSDGSLWTFHRITTAAGVITIRWRCNTGCYTDGTVAVNFYRPEHIIAQSA